ncbi:MAG TPA: HAD family acid phosphatase [Thermoanaerobaculia bacterium]|nr:HAD family acid phosphatase [Thermoanaerobaculia bacterium]
MNPTSATSMLNRSVLPLLISAAILGGCRTAALAPAPGAGHLRGSRNLETLNSVVWFQTSAELDALARQAFSIARERLDQALADPAWSAIPEQKNAKALPPAIIVDVDETVLDNSAFQGRLLERGVAYDEEIWERWVEEARAVAVPGAVDLCRYATERGVIVFYLTNRTTAGEAATRRNLLSEGFPLDERIDVVVTKGEYSSRVTSDKEERRKWIAARYRVLLLIGDAFGDFAAESATSVAERRAFGRDYASWWGTRWIVIPNPMYGEWERIIFRAAAPRSHEEELEQKYRAIDRALP